MKIRALLLALLTVLLSGCAGSGSTVPADDISTSLNPSATEAVYRIGPDDVLFVSVWRNEDLSISVPVRPVGMISMPLVGDVVAAGLTPTEVAENIRGRLSQFVRDPQVAVIVETLASHEYLTRIRVTGSVQTPVSMTYRQGMTVLDAVLDAGGVTELAAANRTKLFRKNGDESQTIEIELGRILDKGDLETNYRLQPGDVIIVPDRVF